MGTVGTHVLLVDNLQSDRSLLIAARSGAESFDQPLDNGFGDMMARRLGFKAVFDREGGRIRFDFVSNRLLGRDNHTVTQRFLDNFRALVDLVAKASELTGLR